tara:strand:+ start:129 stop:1319 length:1191 start_codon:yes stop_codon:yes gene_type:complete
MDKELAQLHDLARDMLLEVQAQYEAGVIPEGFGKSDKKRLDKAISNLDFNPEAYADIMENVMSGDKGPKELMKKIRNVETKVMKAFELLNEDTIHHLVQQRTGGDFSKQVSGDVVRGAIKRLEDRFDLKFSQATGPKGVVRGDTALSNYAHKSDLTQKGAELASGIGKNPDPSTTAHRFGTRGYSKTLTAAETANENALVKALESRIAPQLEDVKVGIATDQPRVQALRKAAPGLERAYMPDNTAQEIAEMQKIARGLPETTKIKTYKPLRIIKGAARLIPGPYDDIALGTGFGGVAAVAALATGGDPAQAFGDVVSDVAVGDLQGGELFDESQDFGEVLQKSREQNARPLMDRLDEGALGDAGRAIKRGGRVSFGSGGVKFTLPEFGLSELLGVN